MSRALVRGLTARGLVLVIGESLLIIAAAGVAAYVRFGEWTWDVISHEHGLFKVILIAVVVQVCLYYADLYDLRKLTDHRELLVRITQALAAASFILAALYFWFPAMMIGRGIFLITSALVISLV